MRLQMYNTIGLGWDKTSNLLNKLALWVPPNIPLQIG